MCCAESLPWWIRLRSSLQLSVTLRIGVAFDANEGGGLGDDGWWSTG